MDFERDFADFASAQVYAGELLARMDGTHAWVETVFHQDGTYTVGLRRRS